MTKLMTSSKGFGSAGVRAERSLLASTRDPEVPASAMRDVGGLISFSSTLNSPHGTPLIAGFPSLTLDRLPLLEPQLPLDRNLELQLHGHPRVLLRPEFGQKGRDPLPEGEQPVDPGVAGCAYRNQKGGAVLPGLPVMDADPMIGAASPAAAAVPVQDSLPDPAEETERVPPFPIAGGAEPGGKGR